MMRRGSLSRKRRSSAFALVLSGSLLLSVVLACNMSSKAKCTGHVTYQNETFTGMGKDAAEAQGNACNKYCLEADPEFDARYGIWLDSPRGRAAGRPTKKESIYKDRSLLDYVTITCMKRCVAAVKAGELKGETECP